MCLPGLLHTLPMGCWWATYSIKPTVLLKGNLHCRAYWPSERLPSLLSLLMGYLTLSLVMGYLHCWANWPSDGLPSLLSLLMGYLHGRAYWCATFTVKPSDGLPTLSSLLTFWWATFYVEPADELPSLSSLVMGYLHCKAYWSLMGWA